MKTEKQGGVETAFAGAGDDIGQAHRCFLITVVEVDMQVAVIGDAEKIVCPVIDSVEVIGLTGIP